MHPSLSHMAGHRMVLYGWGTTEAGAKYWLGRNSYGPTWGLNGSW